MSNPFETQLAERLTTYFQKNPPHAGQVMSAQFQQWATASEFASAVINHQSIERREFQTERETRELPALIVAGGVPVFIVQVVSETEAGTALEQYEVTQSGATTMRDIVSDSVADSEESKAVLMIYQDDISLDTLNASIDLLDDGPLELTAFTEDVLAPGQNDDTATTAFLTGISKVIKKILSDSEDIGIIKQLCEIRAAVENDDFGQLPDLIGALPGFLREDHLTAGAFSNYTDPDDVIRLLESNRGHRDRIHTARQPGRQFKRELSNHYQDGFISDIKDTVDISTINHTEASNGEIDTTKREFIELEVIAGKETHFGVPEPPYSDANRRQAVTAVADGDTVRVRARFHGDMTGVPKCLEYPDGSKDEDPISKRRSTLTATIEVDDPTEIYFVNFQIFVGNETTTGYPSHEFSIAVVPSEIYEILSSHKLDVNVDDKTFVSHGGSSLTLQGPTGGTTETTVVTEGENVDLHGDLTLEPKIPDQVPYIVCTVKTDTADFKLQFQTGVSTADREKITFPLLLAGIAEPEEWTTEDLKLQEDLTVDLDIEEIQIGAEGGVGIEEDVMPLLNIEEQYLETEIPTRRRSPSDSLDFGAEIESLSQPELKEAYSELFAHFEARSRTPSTDSWDEETQEQVRNVLEAYLAAIEDMKGEDNKPFNAFRPLQGLGRIKSATTQKVYLTPYHPAMLAYGLRLSEWRDTLEAEGRTDGFRSPTDAVEVLNPVGLLPYLYSDEEDLLRGTRADQNALWATYSPEEDIGAETPGFVDRVMSHQGTAFIDAFRVLFELHPARDFIINTVNLGDLGPLIEGIFKVYGQLKSRSIDYPEILIQIYGGPTEGERLRQFLQNDAESSLRDRLQRYDDERVEAIRSNVKYVRKGSFDADSIDRAHLTVFQGILEPTAGDHEIDTMDNSLYLDGLLPRESIETIGKGEDTTYITGFGGDTRDTALVPKIARSVNAFEAARGSDSSPEGRSLKRSVEAGESGLESIWQASQWAVHIRPGVGLDFYTRSGRDGDDNETVMIQHSDQYDSSSPGYDVVTSTRQRQPYIKSLRQVLDGHNIGGVLDADAALSYLTAIDGQLVSDIQRGEKTSAAEAVGVIGAIAISEYYLSQAHTEYAWLPTSIGELVGHDAARRSTHPSLLTYDIDGPASDDLCFIGLPTDPDADTIKLWLVEAKGVIEGKNPSTDAVKQVQNGTAELNRNFNPDNKPADIPLIKAAFGNFAVTASERLESYDLFTEQQQTVERWEPRLFNGDFEVEFIETDQGTVGDVVIVGDGPKSTISYEENVRIINLPSTSAALLDRLDELVDSETAQQAIGNVVPDLDTDKLLNDR